MSGAPLRALQLAAVALGVGLVMTVGVARAQDDEERRQDLRGKDHRQPHGRIGATNMENNEASIIASVAAGGASQVDLPPPASTSAEVNDPTGRKIRTKPPQGGHRGPQEDQTRQFLGSRTAADAERAQCRHGPRPPTHRDTDPFSRAGGQYASSAPRSSALTADDQHVPRQQHQVGAVQRRADARNP